MAKAHGKKIEGVPSVFIGNSGPLVGYLSDEVTGKLIEERVVYCIKNNCTDPLDLTRRASEKQREQRQERTKPSELKPPSREAGRGDITKRERKPEEPVSPREESEKRADTRAADAAPAESETIKLPFLGEVDTSRTSLPVLTLVIAGMDGFNPCAFFVLLLLLSILMHAHSRKIMLLIGGTFVFFSGFIYFLFMAAWLNIFLLFGQLKAITVGAGAIALLIALINIKDFFFFRKGVSLTIPEKAKPKLFGRTRGVLNKSSLPAMLSGTVVLAVVANTYELLCTAGFPMVYARALTLHHLSTYQYYLYLVFYNIIYVIPLACIVASVVITLGARKMTEWQGQVLKLISGIMMFYLGLVLLVRPALLNSLLISAGLLGASLLTAGTIILVTKQIKRGADSQ